VSGARFYFLRGVGAQLQWAMLTLAVNKAIANGFIPMIPPVLVKPESMEGTGILGEHADEVYRLAADDLYLVGTSEVPLAAYHSGEILDLASAPARYVGWSSCFRREAGSYGKDTRGIIRVHQFDKVEMFSYADPATSWDEHEVLLAIEESIVGGLGLPYRVVNIAAGDLGAAAAKKYDVEVWLPSEGAYRELTSCSNYLDYSARRLATRVRAERGNQLVHTLNGTACAVGRTLVFLFEHYQDADGGFTVPEVLRPYTGFDRVEPAER
jgi:seryl-tRNA synthetase